MRKPIGIIGASSVVAEYLTQVLPAQYEPLLFSRNASEGQTTGVAEATVRLWISVMPIWATPNYFDLFLARSTDSGRFFHEPFYKSRVPD